MSRTRAVRKVLVTGAAGYQAGERLRRKFELTLFDRVAPSLDHADLPFICGDITDAEVVRRACRDQGRHTECIKS